MGGSRDIYLTKGGDLYPVFTFDGVKGKDMLKLAIYSNQIVPMDTDEILC